MIVNGNVHAADREILDRAVELGLVFVRVDPELVQVWPGESGYFETHQSDMARKRQISVNELNEVIDPGNGQFMQNDADLHRLFVPRETMQALDSLVQCSSCLYNVVV